MASSRDSSLRLPTAADVDAAAMKLNPELHQALVELQARQPLNAQTGSVHAAAWALPSG